MQKNRNPISFLSIAFFLLFFKGLLAQSYYFRNYSVEDGLPFIEVSAIFQDHQGNLWSGGYGGLSKFDGIAFKNYTPENGLLNHLVTAINEDNQNNLWVGTIAGVNKLDGNKFTGYTVKNGLISNRISTILKDSDGSLWFGTDNGISHFINNNFINYTVKQGLINNQISCLYQDKKGTLWIGTSGGISSFENNVFTSYTTQNGLSNNTINAITRDEEQNIWIATANGLCKLSNGKFTCYSTRDGLIDNNIKTIITDHKNSIWLGTDKGLVKFNHISFTNYSIRKDQNSNIISCFIEDYEQNLWIGTSAGLFKYRGNPFISYGIHDNLTNNFIYGIIRDAQSNLWIGSQGGLFKYDNKEFKRYNNENGLNAGIVNAVFEYSPGVLWLATNKGLRIFKNNSFVKNNDTSAINTHLLNCFFKDSKNNIWAGGVNEIFKYDGVTFTRFPFKGRYPKSASWTIVEDKNGTLWIGTYLGGLIKYDGKTFVEWGEHIGIKNDSYLASVIDKDGTIYFGTLEGIWAYNPTNPDIKLTHFSEQDGLSSDLIYSMTFGKTQNEIWVGTNQGLNKINILDYKQTGQKSILHFGKQEGFTGVECNSNGTWVDPDGTIWFGTVYGLIKYSPDEYIENKAESKISITGFSLFYQDTLFENNVHLAYNNNNITFNYSGICLTNPAKVKYSYILEGFAKNWSPPSKERLTTYSNLPPGTYTFKVLSSNNEDVWNTNPAMFTFTINRPYWKTWWFIISSIIVVTFALILSIRLRIRKIKQNEKQKTEFNKKLANIESQALRAQMNPHFIFNTLTSIQHFISHHNSNDAIKYLSKFAKLMRKIMDNSKQTLITVADEIEALHLYLELEVMRFEKKFHYSIQVDKNIDSKYDQIPSMLIQPYIENAIIHGLLPLNGEGKISITLQKSGDTILCTIQDNGIGRLKAEEFKRNSVKQHKSMGMSITQERLAILNSNLKSNINCEVIDLYNNGESAGTKVILNIPLESNE